MSHIDNDRGNAAGLPDNGTTEDRKDIVNKLDELQRDFKEMLSELDPLVLRQWQKDAGPHLKTMLKSYPDTMSYLDNPDSSLRAVALDIALSYWNPADTASSVFERMAMFDPDVRVRDVAICALGTCYARTQDRRIEEMLAAIVQDEHTMESMRLTAFMSLMRVYGILNYNWQCPLVPTSLDEIDWDFMRQFRT